MNATYFVDILQLQERFNVTLKKDRLDDKYLVPFLSSNMNSCRIGKGILPTIMNRVFMETFAQSSNTKISCPFAKNQRIVITNLTFTDSFLPPIKVEKHFRIRVKAYAKIREIKGWTFLSDNFWYRSYKK